MRPEQLILGRWEGNVHPEMGGYWQSLEFFPDGLVSTEISAFPAKIGNFSFRTDPEICYPILEIRFPQISDYMVPYIVKFGEEISDLHLCCPFLTDKLPRTFAGPGYVVMRRSEISSPRNFQVLHGALEDRVRQYLKEVIEVLLRLDIVGNYFESEISANKSAIAVISALTKIDSLAHKFGPEVLTYLENHKKFPINSDIHTLFKLMNKLTAQKGLLSGQNSTSASSLPGNILLRFPCSIWRRAFLV